MKQITLIIFIIVSINWSALADLEQRTNSDNEKEQQIKKIAKHRLYPGGKDEMDLKVQTQLYKPQRKALKEIDPSSGDVEEPQEE